MRWMQTRLWKLLYQLSQCKNFIIIIIITTTTNIIIIIIITETFLEITNRMSKQYQMMKCQCEADLWAACGSVNVARTVTVARVIVVILVVNVVIVSGAAAAPSLNLYHRQGTGRTEASSLCNGLLLRQRHVSRPSVRRQLTATACQTSRHELSWAWLIYYRSFWTRSSKSISWLCKTPTN